MASSLTSILNALLDLSRVSPSLPFGSPSAGWLLGYTEQGMMGQLLFKVRLPGCGRKPWVSVSGMGFETKERQRGFQY